MRPHLADAQRAFLQSISLTLLNFHGYVDAGELTHDTIIQHTTRAISPLNVGGELPSTYQMVPKSVQCNID